MAQTQIRYSETVTVWLCDKSAGNLNYDGL